MGGCCVGLKLKINNDDVLIVPEELKKKEEFINLEKSFIVYNQNIEEIKIEKSTIEQHNQKTNENDKKDNKVNNIIIKVNNPNKEININPNKKRL